MKCPKCGYQSFNDLAACKKCGRDLTEIQARFNLGRPVPPPAAPTAVAEAAGERQRAATRPTPARPATEQNDEQVLEAFFESIDSPDHDQVPLPAAETQQQRPPVGRPASEPRQAPPTFPEWEQPLSQSEFPFEELDADLEVLQQSAALEQPSAAPAAPFDDVEDLDLDWQLPGEAKPVGGPQAAKQQTASAQRPSRPVETAREIPSPPAALSGEENPAEPEWPLPELPADQHAEESFAAGNWHCDHEPAAEAPDRAGFSTIIGQTARQWATAFAQIRPFAAGLSARLARLAALRKASVEPQPAPEQLAAPEPSRPPQPSAPQGELPFPAEESESCGQPAAIAGILLPDGRRDPIGAGARLLALRAKAYLVDLAVLTAIFALFVCAGEMARLPGTAGRFRFTGDVLLDLSAPYFLVLFALCFGYFTLFHYLSGQTPGKMLFDVRVEGDDHASLTLAQAFLRCVGGLISLLPAGLGFLLVVLDGEQRGWNDRLAGSQVVMVKDRGDD